MKVAITCPGTGNAALAGRARQEADRHAARTPERRAAAACWVALTSTQTVDAARRSLATFGSERTQADAVALLGRLAAADCSISYDREAGCYSCAHCGGTSEPA